MDLTLVLAAGIGLGTVLLFAAIGEIFAERAGVLNLGVEGMMLIGAVAGYSTAVGTGNAWLGIPVAMAAAGALSLLHAFVTIHLRADQVISGLALTFLGTGLARVLGEGLSNAGSIGLLPRLTIPVVSEIPVIGPVFFRDQTVLAYVAYLLVPLAWYWINRTRPGLDLRAVGERPSAADAQGIDVVRLRYTYVLVGGLLAGLAGATITLAVSPGWFGDLTTNGRGWIAVGLVIFARWSPIRAAIGAFLFGAIFRLILDIQGLQSILGVPNPFGPGRSTTFFLEMLPYLFVILVVVAGSQLPSASASVRRRRLAGRTSAGSAARSCVPAPAAPEGASGTIPAMFERTTLADGPRVITAPLPAARSVSIAAYVRAGSRLEAPEQAGMAHFLEHLTFKGTAAYPSTRALSEAIEGVGGSFNAATDREATVYWVRVPRRETKRAMTVLGELICRPALDPSEINRERKVIIEEIRGYLDDPAEFAQILFQQAMFGATALGREICGEESDVRSLPAAGIRAFWQATYRPANAVVALAGDVEHAEVIELVGRTFGRGNGAMHGFDPAPALPAGERILTGRRDSTQAQLCLGVPALPRDHPDGWALSVLNAILGDGMSSRLFLSLVDRDALAYDVSSGVVEYADAGALQVAAGVDPGRVGRTLDAILRELALLRDEVVGDDELAKAKAYLSGGLELRMEETRHLASWIGGQEALHDRVLTLDEALDAVARVTSADLTRLAQQLFHSDLLRLAVVAPARSLRGLDRHLTLPA